MDKAQEAQLTPATAQRREYHPRHLGAYRASIVKLGRKSDEEHARSRQTDKDEDPRIVWNSVDEVGRGKLDEKRGDHVREKNDSLWYGRAHQVESSGQNDDVENVVD